jgi:hypothetical protein
MENEITEFGKKGKVFWTRNDKEKLKLEKS